MIRIYVDKSPGNMTVEIHGHAEYEECGKNIVCSGVSAIMQAAELGLRAIAQQYPQHVTVEPRE